MQGNVYHRIIQDVIQNSQVDFEEAGVDGSTLEELKQVRAHFLFSRMSFDVLYPTKDMGFISPLSYPPVIFVVRHVATSAGHTILLASRAHLRIFDFRWWAIEQSSNNFQQERGGHAPGSELLLGVPVRSGLEEVFYTSSSSLRPGIQPSARFGWLPGRLVSHELVSHDTAPLGPSRVGATIPKSFCYFYLSVYLYILFSFYYISLCFNHKCRRPAPITGFVLIAVSVDRSGSESSPPSTSLNSRGTHLRLRSFRSTTQPQFHQMPRDIYLALPLSYHLNLLLPRLYKMEVPVSKRSLDTNLTLCPVYRQLRAAELAEIPPMLRR
jgi:hypothetical protein